MPNNKRDSFTQPRTWTYRLPPAPFKLYAVLLSFTSLKDGCWASNKTVGKKADMSARTVSRWAGELEKQNVITRVEQQDGQALTSWTIMHDEYPPEHPHFAAYKESKLVEHEAKHGQLPQKIRRTPYPPTTEPATDTQDTDDAVGTPKTARSAHDRSGAQVIPTTSNEVLGIEIEKENQNESSQSQGDSTPRFFDLDEDGEEKKSQSTIAKPQAIFPADVGLPNSIDANREVDLDEDHEQRVGLMVAAAVATFEKLQMYYDRFVVHCEATDLVASGDVDLDEFTDFLALIPHDPYSAGHFGGIGKLLRTWSELFRENLTQLNNSLPLNSRELGNTKGTRTGQPTEAQQARINMEQGRMMTGDEFLAMIAKPHRKAKVDTEDDEDDIFAGPVLEYPFDALEG